MPAPTGCLNAGVAAWAQLYPTIRVEMRDVVMTLTNSSLAEVGIYDGEYRFHGSIECTPQILNYSLAYVGMSYGGLTHIANGVETQRDARAVFNPGCVTVDGSLYLYVYGLFLMIPYEYGGGGWQLGFAVFHGVYRWSTTAYTVQPCMQFDNRYEHQPTYQQTGSGRGWIMP